MKKIIASILGLFVMSILVFGQNPVEQSTETAMKTAAATPKAKKEKPPKSDSEIQKCVSDKFDGSEKLRAQGFKTSVSNGEATLTGTAVNAGSKGAATRIAKSCGAKTVANKIDAPPIPRPKKAEQKKVEMDKNH